MDLILPYQWSPRPHQRGLLQYMFNDRGQIRRNARAACVWHRRSGKDSTSLQIQALASQIRIGTYWTMLPTLQQARRVIWDGIDKQGRRMIDQAFPKEMRAKVNETDMKIEFKNGSIWQCVGSDNYDTLVGSNPVGVVFSEYSIADPSAWDYIRPILAENNGFAIFIYTPRGKNHGEKLYRVALNNPGWYATLYTIDDTFVDDALTVPIISKEMYQEELESGMDVMMARQEYYCSFDAGLFGAYYTDQLKLAKVGSFPWNPSLPVCTAWDMGLRDATAIWFFQQANKGGAINVIDYWNGTNIPRVEWYRKLNESPYNFSAHIGPHDLESRDPDYGVRGVDTAAEHNVFFDIAPRVSLATGIDQVRNFLPRLQFNENTTEPGISALQNYRKEWNNKLQVFVDKPVHDWSSHGADAMRYAALGYMEGLPSFNNMYSDIDYSELDRMAV